MEGAGGTSFDHLGDPVGGSLIRIDPWTPVRIKNLPESTDTLLRMDTADQIITDPDLAVIIDVDSGFHGKRGLGTENRLINVLRHGICSSHIEVGPTTSTWYASELNYGNPFSHTDTFPFFSGDVCAGLLQDGTTGCTGNNFRFPRGEPGSGSPDRGRCGKGGCIRNGCGTGEQGKGNPVKWCPC